MPDSGEPNVTSTDELQPSLLDAYCYELPEDRIAQQPREHRDEAKLLVVHPDGHCEDRIFHDLLLLLRAGDLLVLNETRVRRARLHGLDSDGRTVELFVVELLPDGCSSICLVRPGKHLHEGSVVTVDGTLQAHIAAHAPHHPGARIVEWTFPDDMSLSDLIEKYGEMPLPPYIHDRDHDTSYYQTVYAQGDPSSVAAPTAGLHFTRELLSSLDSQGIGHVTIDLTVGMGTFLPIRTERITDHTMHEERFTISPEVASRINETRRTGGRIIAVGTTVVRVLESVVDEDGFVHSATGSTRLYIRPGHVFRSLDGLITNFHQPGSSLVVLVATLLGYKSWRDAYKWALDHQYQFLSYGDAMLCWLPQKSATPH